MPGSSGDADGRRNTHSNFKKLCETLAALDYLARRRTGLLLAPHNAKVAIAFA
jgi:hypothetical protein